MSSDETFQVQPTPPKKSGTNVLLVLGIGCGVMVLLCCGIGGVGVWWIGRQAQNMFIADPAEADAVGREIAQVDLPDRYEAKFAMDMSIITSRIPTDSNTGVPTRGVWYVDGEGGEESVLMMYEIQGGDAANAEMNGRQMELQMSQQQEGGVNTDIPTGAQTVNTQVYERTLRDEPAKFTITEYRAEGAEQSIWQAQGAFKNDDGWVFFMLVDKAPDTDEAEIKRILDSIE